MRICIVVTHPTQFDVPVFRLGREFIDVIYVNRNRCSDIYDPEIRRNIKWEENNLEGYNYSIIPEKGKFLWMYKKIRNGKYDLLITNGYSNKYYLWSIIQGSIFCYKNSIRVDTVQYNNTGIIKRSLKFFWYQFLKLFVNNYFVVGTLSKNYLIKNGIRPSQIFLYGYVSNNSFFKINSSLSDDAKAELRKKYGIAEDRKILLCISKHNEREAPIDTIQAFKNLESESLHLLLVGDGPMHNDLKVLVEKLGIQNVTFAGYVAFQSLPQYYAISTAFIHDSHNEPWGVSVQEAISCNIPVIAADKVGAAHDLIIPSKNGYIFKTGDVVELTEKIKSALKLDQTVMNSTNHALLENWNYESVVSSIREAAKTSK